MDRALVDRFFMQEIEYMDADNEEKVLSNRCGIDSSEAKIIVTLLKLCSDSSWMLR